MKQFRYVMAAFCLLTFGCSQPKNSEMTEEEAIEKARVIHERVITLDTHNDINTSNFTPETNYTQRLNTQVNLPKMNEGGLDVTWLIV